METWNREELYAEVWEQPLVKLAPKYGTSNMTLGKVCRKLQIRVPGRGYWAKKVRQTCRALTHLARPTTKKY